MNIFHAGLDGRLKALGFAMESENEGPPRKKVYTRSVKVMVVQEAEALLPELPVQPPYEVEAE